MSQIILNNLSCIGELCVFGFFVLFRNFIQFSKGLFTPSCMTEDEYVAINTLSIKCAVYEKREEITTDLWAVCI